MIISHRQSFSSILISRLQSDPQSELIILVSSRSQPPFFHSRKCACPYALPDLIHEAKHEMQIMQGGQTEVGQLPGDIEMAKIGSRVGAAGRTGAVWIYWQPVLFEFCRLNINMKFIVL